MKSIREIYKIGKGPSSSHTMGPERAAGLFRSEFSQADGFRVILYGSLSKTGVGHGTDRVIRETLAPLPTEILFSNEELPADAHPNTMDLIALQGDEIHGIGVGIGGKLLVGEQDLGGQRCQCFPDDPVGAVAHAGFAERTIENDPEAVRLGELTAEESGGPLRSHGVGRAGAFADFVDFPDRFHSAPQKSDDRGSSSICLLLSYHESAKIARKEKVFSENASDTRQRLDRCVIIL